MSDAAADQPRWLEGIRVLDLTKFVAGPASTRLLVEMGAEVVKVEQPPYGDPNRSGRPRINKRSALHIQQNRGKKSLCLDIHCAEGQEIIRELVPHFDVVVENFSPGVLDRRGLGYADLSAIKPDLIYASVSGFGHSGPWSQRPAFDLIAQAMTGFMHMTGEPDGPPMFVGSAIADTNAGVHAWGAIGHALFMRERTGKGTHLDVAMTDALFHAHDTAVTTASLPEADAPVAIRAGKTFNSLTPAGTFKGPEGWFVILCTQDQMPAFWRALGEPPEMHEERFRTNPNRVEHQEELAELVEAWMASLGSDDAVAAALTEHRVPHAPVLSLEQAIEHEHFVERGTVRTVTDPRLGEVKLAGFPVRTSEPLPDDDHVAAALGEHNREVLAGYLSMTDAEIDALTEQGVLASKPH
ncbi:MAG: CoA transferase [Actinomycetota bacterium]